MSKSVRLSTSAAATGSTKNVPIRSSAGARKNHPAAPASDAPPRAPQNPRRSGTATGGAATGAACPEPAGSAPMTLPIRVRSSGCQIGDSGRAAVEHPPPLLQDLVHVAVERGEGVVGRALAARHLLGGLRHARGDRLPLRDRRHRVGALELLVEGARARVAGERAVAPRRQARREVAGQLVEPKLPLWRREELYQPPRRVLVR